MELHALAGEAFDQLAEVLLVADVAGAGRVPEMHQADRPRPGQLGRQAQAVAGEQGGLLAERADVADLEPPVGGEQAAGPEQADQADEERLAAGSHGIHTENGCQACHVFARS